MSELRYRCDRGALPAHLRGSFVELFEDDETLAFIARAERERVGAARGFAHALLRHFLSDFDVNGLLDTYPLHLLGRAQAARLLGPAAQGRLLDVGAGAGDVTAHLAPLFDDVVAVETSFAMARRLRRRGFVGLRRDLVREPVPEGPWHTIALLNVLDRCPRPRSLLARLVEALGSGTLLVSMPLPYRPHYYSGGATRDPLEPLDVKGPTWEASAGSLVDHVLVPAGLEPVRLARVPYLSGGDEGRALYVLDAVVVALRRRA